MKPLNSTMATAPNAVGSRLPTPSWMPSPLAPPIPLWPDQRPENCRRMRTKIGTNPNTSSLNLHHLLVFNHRLVRRHPVPPPTPPHLTSSSASIYNAAASSTSHCSLRGYPRQPKEHHKPSIFTVKATRQFQVTQELPPQPLLTQSPSPPRFQPPSPSSPSVAAPPSLPLRRSPTIERESKQSMF